MRFSNDSYQAMVHPSYWQTSSEDKVFNELDCGGLVPQVSDYFQNLSEEAYQDLDVIHAHLVKERCQGKDLGDHLNKAVDALIAQLGKNL